MGRTCGEPNGINGKYPPEKIYRTLFQITTYGTRAPAARNALKRLARPSAGPAVAASAVVRATPTSLADELPAKGLAAAQKR